MNRGLAVVGLSCVVGILGGVSVVFAQGPPANNPTVDQLIGDYVGTFQPKQPEGKPSAKAKKCEGCHAEALVSRAEKEYVLTLIVEHGKDKEGKPKMQRFTFKGQPANEGLLFQNEKYSITVTDGKIAGTRTGKMAASMTLERKPALETKSPTAGAK